MPRLRWLFLVLLLAACGRSNAGPLYVDVRTPEEYAAGHVRDAINIPLEQLEQRWIELGDRRGERIIVYCRSGRRSALALQLLQGKDFTKVEDGGALNAPSAAGVPTEQ
jgi:phage shock protein E